MNLNFWTDDIRAFVQKANASVPQTTPDLCLLEQADRHLVFEYGELQLPMKKMCSAVADERLVLLQQNYIEGRPPVVLRTQRYPKAKISGNLCSVTTQGLVQLDTERQNGVVFQRKHIRLLLPYQDHNGLPVQTPAWIYVGVWEHWQAQVEWDQEFYRGRAEGVFSLAERVNCEGHYKYRRREALSSSPCFMHIHENLKENS